MVNSCYQCLLSNVDQLSTMKNNGVSLMLSTMADNGDLVDQIMVINPRQSAR